jgi:hypothetical protein
MSLLSSHTRWVGFDMDECLGSFMGLWPFCELLPKSMNFLERSEYYQAVAERISESSKHWLFRPGLDRLLTALVAAQRKGQIVGCFILSNNGSAELVEMVRLIMNHRASRGSTPGTPLFLAGWHRFAKCRRGNTSKEYDLIQNCLASQGLPLITGANDLLFFDDMRHLLTDQIPHYIQVQPYFNYTPVEVVMMELMPVFKRLRISMDRIQSIVEAGKKEEADDLVDDTSLLPYPPSAGTNSQVFIRALADFLKTTPETRRTTRRYKRTSGKTRRRNMRTAAAGATKIERV